MRWYENFWKLPNTEDVIVRRTSGRATTQVPTAHEFGYELRQRYFRTLIEELNDMIPGVTFSIHSV